MAYSEILANRLRGKFAEYEDLVEKPMMGGLTFMLNGKMCVGIIKDELMCRIDPDLHHEAIEKPGCRTMDFTKKPMRGYVMIDQTGIQSTRDFNYWVDLAIAFNAKAKASKKKN
jgi:TfoX/Sxy family transcriptional regulator of competence genes